MADRPNIDYAHYAAMLDLVEKITKVSPRSTNLLNVAMEEIKELDEECKAHHDEVAKELAAEKAEAAAKEQARQKEEAELNQPRAIPASELQTEDDDIVATAPPIADPQTPVARRV